ncbi:MAG: DNA polymerase III subunit beta [Candidatus Pacebacteria bacterium]|nr:DNA polymerase III subunit beta [Candidatus Paceibacterota bacterium]
MHISLTTTELKSVLETIARVSTKHLTLPVLQCVYLEATGDTVAARATNLEIGIEGTLAAQVTEAGVVAVPAHVLLQTINLSTERTVTLRTEGDVLFVETKASHTQIKSIPAEEFPSIPKITEGGQRINGALFAVGVKTAAFAASQSSIKPELGSVYVVQKKEHTLTFVATDSFRLMEKTVAQQGVVFPESILIPYKNALELAHIADGDGCDVTLYVNENQCALTVGNIYITSRLTNGSFPDYGQIIPKEYILHVTTLTSDVAHALKKTNIFLNKFLQVTISVSNTDVTLSAQSGEVGTTTETFTASVEGEPLTLNFNQRYISEVMGHIVDDSIVMRCAGIGRPMVIENVNDRSMRYLVMPMNK